MNGPDSEAFTKALKYFEFDKHKSHRWLLLERSRRESVLREAELLDVLEWREQPVHVGDIVRAEQSFEWGHVLFRGMIAGFNGEQPSSVYAAFEYLIRQCKIFPSFISLADLRRCSKTGLRALPVYGLRFSLDELESGQRHAALTKMLQLLSIEPREDLLLEKVCEVTDGELFEHYFRQMVDKKAAQAEHGQNPGDSSSLTLDDIDAWHT